MRLDPAQLDALAAAVDEGTFDAAALSLHVTPSAVSQRIKALETAVGRVLLTRGKPVRPTQAGEAVLRLALQVRSLTSEVARELGAERATPAGLTDAGLPPAALPLAVNADSLATWFLPALATVTEPVTFELHRADQEHTADLLRQGTVMAAVTASAVPVPGCTVELLGVMRYRPCATAEFARRWFADGVGPASLGAAPVVLYDRADDLQDRYLRRRSRRPLTPPRHLVPASADFVAAIRLGLGWGMVPDLQSDRLRATGDLVELDPAGQLDIRLHWQQWRLRTNALDAVADAVRRAAANALSRRTTARAPGRRTPAG